MESGDALSIRSPPPAGGPCPRGSEPKPPHLAGKPESIVKLIFATHGSTEQLLEHLHDFRDHATARWKAVAAVFRPHLDGEEPFPDRAHVNTLAASLVLETARVEAAWADRAIEEVQKWHTTAEPRDRASTIAALELALASGVP